jgi:Glyoxalase/Bleomycin resistance protein/Dioxygenase superfamily
LLSLHSAKRCGLHHIAFGMSDEEDVDRTAEELQSRGIRLVSEPQPLNEPGGGYGFRFIDLEGRCIELSVGVIQHQGGWETKGVQPHSICHVVLNTAQIDAMIEFYTKMEGEPDPEWQPVE